MFHRPIVAVFVVAWSLFNASFVTAHPLGNFSISQYSAIRIGRDLIDIRYIIDMAEIPTFQELQEGSITPTVGDASVQRYLTRKAEVLRDGLSLRIDGKPVALEINSTDIIFPPGAGGLPTMKIGVLFKATVDGDSANGQLSLDFRDGNFPGRAGWKEIVAVANSDVKLTSSSVPRSDRSRQLSDYPTDLLNSPPQQLEARVSFGPAAIAAPASATASVAFTKEISPKSQAVKSRSSDTPASNKLPPTEQTQEAVIEKNSIGFTLDNSVGLKANRQSTPRDSFTELLANQQLGLGIILIALAVAASLGAFHALEPGHGKTLIAAYLVGSRGTAKHAILLGLIVTAAHTAGVYLLGGVTLYASRYIVPEQLYPWLGVVSGIMIAGLGLVLLVRRYLSRDSVEHAHHHHTRHPHASGGHHYHYHDHDQGHQHDHHVRQVSMRELLTLGISGGIIPCPAALVVLLSAVSLQRIGFGLLLIVAFSLGLAVVLIGVGMLMVYARQFMSRFHGEGRIVTRWLPLTSSAFIVLVGIGMTWQALAGAGLDWAGVMGL